MGQTDNFFISLIAPEKAVTKEGWSEKFGMGSRPTSDPEAAALTELGPERLYVHIRDRVLRDHGDDVVSIVVLRVIVLPAHREPSSVFTAATTGMENHLRIDRELIADAWTGCLPLHRLPMCGR